MFVRMFAPACHPNTPSADAAPPNLHPEPVLETAPEPGPTVCCVTDSIVLQRLMETVPDTVLILEPSPSQALRLCLEDERSRLLVDLAALDPYGLSALAQFRAMRPDQEIVLLGGAGDARHLDDSSLGGLPVITVPRERRDPHDRYLRH